MSACNDYGLNDVEILAHLDAEIAEFDKLMKQANKDGQRMLEARYTGSRNALARLACSIRNHAFRMDVFVDTIAWEDFIAELYGAAYAEGYSSAKMGNATPIDYDNGLQQKRREIVFKTTWRYRVSPI